MPPPRPGRARGPALLLVAAAVITVLLGACESGPIVRGAGSEHWQRIRIGLPF